MSLDPTRFALDEYQNANYTLTVESGTSLEDVLQPAFLANVAPKLRPYDRIRVRVDSGEWYAELLVLSCGRVWAKMVPIFTLDLTSQEIEQMVAGSLDQFYIKHRGPHLGWCVIRAEDNEPLKEQCASKREAQVWLDSYVMTL